MSALTKAFGALLFGLLQVSPAPAAEHYSFGVLSQRSAVLTAEHWYPILDYVSRKTGYELVLKVARTAQESNAAIRNGEYDFAYSNHLFRPSNQLQHYRVILRPRSEAIRGQIVTLAGSSLTRLDQLQDRVVGFPSRAAFVGYAVPMDHLVRLGIHVRPVFGGNQEGIMGQLMVGKVAAACVNSQVMRYYARRKRFSYHVLWQSTPYDNIPIAVHPRVPEKVVMAVRQAFVGMSQDPSGRHVLLTSARVIQQKSALGFVSGSNSDYQEYLDFYEHADVAGIE